MNVLHSSIPEVLVFEPNVFGDDRGYFFESFNQKDFAQAVGQSINFVQDNHSKSSRGVLRGLHYQIQQAQGKLIRVVAGAIFDVAVDIRRSSPTFGQWVGQHLSAENKQQMWVPAGFAHGFLVMSETTEVLYKTTDFYAPASERCIAWNDSEIGITWPDLGIQPLLSSKDQLGVSIKHAELFA
ncbi:MAG: dTDP-4-dehydrorhamnose 3,5-epimerase [Methylobacillus glycogenes]|nr:dTDP-4-dehydrorhamnose 3,5-epimerase [Methylobacillus glycogenes]